MLGQHAKVPESVKRRSIVRFLFEGVEGFAMAIAVLVSWPLSRNWLINWGSSRAEQESTWPGDSLVNSDYQTATRAIDIDAPAEVIWSWLVQFGLGRAGFYSYELLERLAGIPVVNAESVSPEWQSLSVGEKIVLHPKAPGVPIGRLNPGKYICLGESPESRETVPGSEPARSWSMYIVSKSHSNSRLILRACIESDSSKSFSKRLTSWIESPIDFVMEQRMLRTLKRLAEATNAC